MRDLAPIFGVRLLDGGEGLNDNDIHDDNFTIAVWWYTPIAPRREGYRQWFSDQMERVELCVTSSDKTTGYVGVSALSAQRNWSCERRRSD
jgi:hypothetical protein